MLGEVLNVWGVDKGELGVNNVYVCMYVCMYAEMLGGVLTITMNVCCIDQGQLLVNSVCMYVCMYVWLYMRSKL
jgi:hypothetical protein